MNRPGFDVEHMQERAVVVSSLSRFDTPIRQDFFVHFLVEIFHISNNVYFVAFKCGILNSAPIYISLGFALTIVRMFQSNGH